jgi:hypothetical protein
MNNFEIDPDLSPGTKLYRYIALEHFMSFVETKRIHLTNVNLWDDKWEVILSKLPTINEKGELIVSLYSFYELIFGQCWSLVQESDAMWRVYSPNKTGFRITTSVEKFKLIRGAKQWRLGKVTYFERIEDILEKAKSNWSPFSDALFKRSAFDHEHEVRFLTHRDFLDDDKEEKSHVNLPVNPREFIEGVTIDPRADEWYVETITKYCERIGLGITPVKSSLYETDPQLKVGWVRQWVPVDKK